MATGCKRGGRGRHAKSMLAPSPLGKIMGQLEPLKMWWWCIKAAFFLSALSCGFELRRRRVGWAETTRLAAF